MPPLQRLLRGVVDELLFGTRPDPLVAASRVAGAAEDPLTALRTIREALVLPYAGLALDGELVSSSGTPTPHVRRWPLALGEGRTGELVVGLRPGGLGLGSGDGYVLTLVAPLPQSLREETTTALHEIRGLVYAMRPPALDGHRGQVSARLPLPVPCADPPRG